MAQRWRRRRSLWIVGAALAIGPAAGVVAAFWLPPGAAMVLGATTTAVSSVLVPFLAGALADVAAKAQERREILAKTAGASEWGSARPHDSAVSSGSLSMTRRSSTVLLHSRWVIC